MHAEPDGRVCRFSVHRVGRELGDCRGLWTPSGAGLQAASWLASVPYGAAKVLYAVSGGVVGSLAWVMTGGNTDIAKAIWSPTMTGHYIVQPQNLTGDQPLHFVGGGSSD